MTQDHELPLVGGPLGGVLLTKVSKPLSQLKEAREERPVVDFPLFNYPFRIHLHKNNELLFKITLPAVSVWVVLAL